MQRDDINNGQHIDAIQISYCKTGVVYTCRSGLLVVTPDQAPIRSGARIGSNSSYHMYEVELEPILALGLIGVRSGVTSSRPNWRV